jgi:hypothetical protein
MSEQKLNIYQKLLTIQKKINGLGKDKTAMGYKYVTGDKVLGEIKPLMNDLGLLLKQEIISIENQKTDYKVSLFQNQETKEWNGKPKIEILSKVMMKFTWVDSETGEKDENLFGANGMNDFDKGVGSALTYGERYFLLKYFHIATDEDDIDNPDRKKEEVPPTPPPPKTPPPAAPKQKPSLNANTPEYAAALKWLREGNKITDIEKKYSLTVEVKEKLISEAI